MILQTQKLVRGLVICMSALTLLWVVFGASSGVAQASASQQSTTKAITETLPLGQDKMDTSMAMSETMPAETNPMNSAAHLEQMMTRMAAMEARMAAMEQRMGEERMGKERMDNQAGAVSPSCPMMNQGMMKGGMMGSMAEMHAMMAEMHAQMAMMATMSEMHRMMGQGGMMGQDGMKGQGAPPADTQPNASAQPAGGASIANSAAQTATLGELEIKVTPLDLSKLSAETIAFTVDLNSSSGDIQLDLAKLAFIEAGMQVEAASWEVILDHGHHVQGTLTFPLTHGGGHRYLDGAKSVTVVIHAAQGDEKVSFTWPLP